MAVRAFKFPSSASSWAEENKWDRTAAFEWNADVLTSGMSDPMFNLFVEYGNKDSIRKQDNSLFELEQLMLSEYIAARAAGGLEGIRLGMGAQTHAATSYSAAFQEVVRATSHNAHK